MGKAATPRRLHETEASAYARALKTSPRKLNLVAQAIRGKAASAALNELAFNRRRIARDVRKVLQAAIANAENNHQLDVDRLYVKEATVGRAFSLGRFHVRGRGRISPVEKYFSNLLVVVRERAPEERAKDTEEGEAETKTAGAGKKSKAKAGGKEKA
jgi:large subunit ribosomal protein L22